MKRVRLSFCMGVASAGVLALALSGCGKPNQSASSPSAAPAEAEGGPANLTDAQKKTLLAELPPAYQAADLSNGEARIDVCRSCHTFNQGGEDMTGPNLWGIFGRKAGSRPGFDYSDDMKHAGWIWDADRIDKWIENPRAVLPDTKMTFIGLPDANDRRDVVAYLKLLTSPPPKA